MSWTGEDADVEVLWVEGIIGIALGDQVYRLLNKSCSDQFALYKYRKLITLRSKKVKITCLQMEEIEHLEAKKTNSLALVNGERGNLENINNRSENARIKSANLYGNLKN